VLARISHDLRRGIEAHRLGIQERAGERGRVVAFQIGRDIGEHGKGRRMAFGEAIFAEPLDLAETVFGELPVVTAPDHAGDELLAQLADRAHAPEGRHGTAQLVRFRRGETGGNNGDLHGLFLKQRHPERLAEHLLQFL